jgi:hypothetical protein
MSKTITGATKTGIILTDPADNPVSNAANATGIASIGYAISGSAQAFWTISNSGTLSGGSAGVFYLPEDMSSKMEKFLAERVSMIMSGRVPACGGHWRFRLPRHTRVVRLVLRVWTPAHTEPGNNDARTLGVAIRHLSLDGQEIGLDSPLIGSGWNVSESGWRWTAGNAALAVEGASELAFEIAMAGHYLSGEPDLAAMPSLTPRALALRAA